MCTRRFVRCFVYSQIGWRHRLLFFAQMFLTSRKMAPWCARVRRTLHPDHCGLLERRNRARWKLVQGRWCAGWKVCFCRHSLHLVCSKQEISSNKVVVNYCLSELMILPSFLVTTFVKKWTYSERFNILSFLFQFVFCLLSTLQAWHAWSMANFDCVNFYKGRIHAIRESAKSRKKQLECWQAEGKTRARRCRRRIMNTFVFKEESE